MTRSFTLADTKMIACSWVMVEAEHANAVNHIGQPIFRITRAARGTNRHLPYHEIDELIVSQNQPFPQQQLRPRWRLHHQPCAGQP